MKRIYSISLILFTTLLSSSLWGQTHIQAQFKPSRIYPDQLTNYVVTVSGAESPGTIGVPEVEGLMIVSTSSSRNFSLGTGRSMSMQSNNQFTIRAEKAGTYTIPAYTIEVGGKKETVPAATLTVLQMSKSRQQALDDQERKKKEALDDMFSLQLDLKREKIYLGQALPVDIQLFVKENVRVVDNAPNPEKTGDSFTTTEFSSEGPQQERVRGNNGSIYNLVTWRTVITPIKTGKQELGFSFEAVISMPSQGQRRRNSFFGSIFEDMHNKRQQVTAYTDSLEIDVLPLPEKDKPDNFTGAIGRFSMNEPELSDKQVQAGEPVTLSLEISGRGNFERINPPTLEKSDGWQVYDPEQQFVAADNLGYEGSKRFEYTIIPQDKAVKETPTLTFSYFDPETERYVSYSPQPIPIEVLPAKSIAPIQVPVNAYAQNQNQVVEEEKEQVPESLLPLKLKSGTWVKKLKPIFTSPTFLAGQAIPFLVILSLFAIRKKQLKLMHDVAYTRKLKAQKAVDSWLKKANAAAQQNNARDFYEAAVRSIQELIGGEIQQEAESLTLAEIEAHMVGSQADPELLVPLRDFFEAGDAIKFSGGNEPLPNPADELTKLKTLITRLAKAL